MSRNEDIKNHVNYVKQAKSDAQMSAALPGIELLYEPYDKHNATVHAVLNLWESHADVTTEQALVQLVDALAKQNSTLSEEVYKLHQNSTRPVIVHGNATGARIITGSYNREQ